MKIPKINSFTNSLFVKNIAKLSSSSIILYLLPIAVTPLLSRLYTPSSFGNWGVFSSVITIIGVILLGSYEYVIIKAPKRETNLVIQLCCIVSFSVICTTILIFLIGYKLNIDFFRTFPPLLYLITYLVFAAIYSIGNNTLNKEKRYTLIAIGSIIVGVGQALFRILFGLLKFEENGIIIGTVIAYLLGALFIIIIKQHRIKLLYKKIHIDSILYIAKKYKKFPLYDTPSSLLAFVAFNYPIIILSSYFSRAEIGCYSMVVQLLFLPNSFIGIAIGNVYYQRICESGTTSIQIKQLTAKIIRILYITSLLPTGFILFGGYKVLIWFLGEQWTNIGSMSTALCLWGIPVVLTQPLLPIYRKFNSQNKLLIFNALYCLFGIATVWIGCLLHLTINNILCYFAFSCFIVKIFLFINILKTAGISIYSIPYWWYICMNLIIMLWIYINYLDSI